LKKFTCVFVLIFALCNGYAAPFFPDFQWPMGNGYGNDVKITSPFGYRSDVFLPGQGGDDSSMHFALDMIPKDGSYKVVPILAAYDGTAVDVYPAPGGKFRGHPTFGGCVLLKHDLGIVDGKHIYAYTFYAHMKEVDISTKEKVKKGELIGVMGSTGKSDGAHLHFEIRFDPRNFLQVTSPPKIFMTCTSLIQFNRK